MFVNAKVNSRETCLCGGEIHIEYTSLVSPKGSGWAIFKPRSLSHQHQIRCICQTCGIIYDPSHPRFEKRIAE